MSPVKVLILRALTRKGEMCVHEIGVELPTVSTKTLRKYCELLKKTGYVRVAYAESRGFKGGGPKVNFYARTSKSYDDPEGPEVELEPVVDERAIDEKYRRDGSDFPKIDMSIVLAMNAIVRVGRQA